jgi:hypothetical protein
LALRYMFEPLDTEFGAYFMNYHSRAPIFSASGAPGQPRRLSALAATRRPTRLAPAAMPLMSRATPATSSSTRKTSACTA